MCPSLWCFHKDSFHPPKNFKQLPLCPLYRWKNRGSNAVLWDMEEPGCDHRPSGSVPCTLDSALGGEVWGGILPWEGQKLFLGGSDVLTGI